MKKVITITLVFFSVFFFTCSDNKEQSADDNTKTKGGVVRGGILKVNEVDYFKSLLPIAINEINAYHIGAQIYEGLVKYNQFDLTLTPGLARSWDISADLTEYTFHLRSNAKFHDDSCFKDGKGRFANAYDVKYCFENLCSRNINNNQYDVTFKDRVEGANENFEQSNTGRIHTISGLTILDDSTLKIKLTSPDPNFLNILAMPGCFIYAKEAGLLYGNNLGKHCIGTGPFYLSEIKEGQSITLVKNPNYWAYDLHGNRLPYLDGIRWTFIPDKLSEVQEFRKGNLDAIYSIPVDLFHQTLGNIQNQDTKGINFDIYTSPALSTHFFGFDLQTNPFFSIKEIRQAFNLAIDREKLERITLKGEGSAAVYGIVPYTKVFEKAGYDYTGLRGYKYNPDSAKKLLIKAGYAKGMGLPDFTIEINNGGGERNLMVALAVQKMLKENLGVNVNMSIVTWNEHINNVQSGKSDFFRYAWVSDYPDPESFLTLFYGKHVPEHMDQRSYINVCRFKNNRYDSLFLAARSELDKAKRYKLLQSAEQILLDEAAFMPLFYDENLRLVQKSVKNFRENPMNYMDMTYVYFSSASR